METLEEMATLKGTKDKLILFLSIIMGKYCAVDLMIKK